MRGSATSEFLDGFASVVPVPFTMTATFLTAAPRAGVDTRARDVPSSFRAVYDRYFDFVWKCTRRMGVRIEDVDDVVQEVFVVVHGRLDSLDQHESLRSWIYGTVRRTVSTYRRAALGRSHRELLEPSPDDNANPLQPSQLELAMQSDELQLLWRLLEQVDPVKREVFVLSELEEMTVPEIAEAIGIGVNTAYSRLRAGKQEYCAAFARYVAQQKGRP